MKGKKVFVAGLATFLVGFAIMIAGRVNDTQGMAVGGAVVMVLGVIMFFYYLLSSPSKKAKK